MRPNAPRAGWVLVLSFGLGLTSMAASVTGFRHDGSGRYPDATPTLTWGPASNVLWKTALPDWSNASPILVAKRIFVCAEPATLIGLDAATGAILWQDTLSPLPAQAPKTHPANGYTSPTPCSDGQRIWTVFGQGLVACWDVSGKRYWSTSLETPPHGWGGCISPRLAGERLIVQFNRCFGLDARTGAVQWTVKTEWGWGSPVVARIGKTDALFTCKGAVVDPATGQALSQGLVKLDYNSPALVDGIVYYLQQKPQAYALPASLTEAPRPLWTNAQITGDRYYGTPLVHDGLVYAINQARQLSVLDQQTGALVYEQRVGHLQGIVYPSPTLGGKHIFLSSEGGQTVVIETGRTYRVVAENSLESFRSCPVFAGRRMYIRGLKHLWCIGEK